MKFLGLIALTLAFAVPVFAQDGAADPQANPMQQQGMGGTETTAPAQQPDQMGMQNQQQQVAPDQGPGPGPGPAQGNQGAQGAQNQNNPQDTTATTY